MSTHTNPAYVVIRAPEGSAQEYIGSVDTIDDAYDLIARHERGDVTGTPESLWETARAARNPVPGCDYPEPHEDEPEEWAGEDGYYAICRIIKDATT